MVLTCSYEELTSLSETARAALAASPWHATAVVAPPEAIVSLEALLPRLEGDLSIETLAEQQEIERAMDFVLEYARDRMDGTVLTQHAAAEDAVNAYFDYAHILDVRERVREVGNEMAALIELMTGRPPTPETSRRITFND